VPVKAEFQQVMSFVEYEKFLSELDTSGEHKVLLIDFLAIGG
jgi:hypothetical protein